MEVKDAVKVSLLPRSSTTFDIKYCRIQSTQEKPGKSGKNSKTFKKTENMEKSGKNSKTFKKSGKIWKSQGKI